MFEQDMKKLECATVRNELVAHVFDGNNLAEACALMKINPAALGMYRRNDLTFDADIRAGQAFRVDVMVDKLENISAYESDSFMAGVVSKNIQWLATKRYRAIYGDKMDVNHNVTINIREAMNAARERVTIEHEPNAMLLLHNATDSVSVAPVEAARDIDPLS